jgi:hypothetical protein
MDSFFWKREGEGSKSAGDTILDLLSDPFQSQLQENGLYAALGTSLGFTLLIALGFSLIRPHHQAIYAPKLKHADEKHAPPPLGKSLWAWIPPLFTTKEDQLMQQIGMDATIFLRFTGMCRNMFIALAIIGVGILAPVNVSKSVKYDQPLSWLINMSPLNVYGKDQWVQVVVLWVSDVVIAAFLWWNYRKVMQLRRKYFDTEEYQSSLHSRTLMLFDIPREACSDEGIARLIDAAVPNASFARTAVARNVKELPELIEQHDSTVRKLESVLAKYLKNPQQLPPNRPTCKPSKKDRAYGTYAAGQKVDAIDYYTQRIRTLEEEIKSVRASVDRRSTMPYGFASYSDISEAHSIAYSCRKKSSHGATIELAPRPNDIIWRNMPLSSSVRNRRRVVNSFWMVFLTLLWIAPNALIAIFLVNLSNLGRVWPDFQRTLEADTAFWGIVQGILAPALTSLVYLVLPMIFRRLSTKGGDQTKTGRERHVIGKMYAFLVFNNLFIFSVFSTVWTFVSTVISGTNGGQDAWKSIEDADIAGNLFRSFCLNSPFWVSYLLQRQLGAAIDLAQMWSLVQAFFMKKFSSPTPRELIELTAPPPFEFASYYTYFLFYATITLCFGCIQPLCLVATALFFALDSYLKKYLILYRFVTKTESGGLYWRVIFNRFIFASVLANLVVLLTTWVMGDPSHIQFYASIPPMFLMVAFKFWCCNMFEPKIKYYSLINMRKNPEAGVSKEARMRNDKLASRFGHPALYKKLITPMVHQKAQNMLPSVYSGRLTDGREADAADVMSVSGYSDMYALDSMKADKAGKTAEVAGVPGFEFVSENRMDFEYYKNRDEFADQHGGGSMYGNDITRPGTPGSLDGQTMLSGRTTPVAFGQPRRVGTGMSDTSYQTYRPNSMVMSGDGAHSRIGSGSNYPDNYPERARSPLMAYDNSSMSALMQSAASIPMGLGSHGYEDVPTDERPSASLSRPATPSYGGPSYGGPSYGGPSYGGPYQDRPSSRVASPAPYSRGTSPGPSMGLRGTSPGPSMGLRGTSPGPSMGALGGGPQGYSGLPKEEADGQDPAQYNYFRGNRNNREPGQGW